MIKQTQKLFFKLLEEELTAVLAVLILAVGALFVYADGNAATVTLTVYPVGGSITVTAPDGGESWQVDSTQNITWTTLGSIDDVKIELQRTAGGDWTTIIASTTNDGSYPWPVTSPTTSTAKVKLSKVGDPSVFDESNSTFSIVAAPSGGGGGGTVYDPWPPEETEEEIPPPIIDDTDEIELVDVEPKEIYSLLGAYFKPRLKAPVVITPLIALKPSQVSKPQEIKLLPRLLEVISIQAAKKLLVLEVEIKPKILSPGEYDLEIQTDPWRIIVPRAIRVQGGTLNASWVRQSDYPTVAPGEEFEMWVEFKNTGTTPWLQGVPAQVRLGTSRPRDRNSLFRDSSWLSNNRLVVLDRSIPSGGIGRFTFKMKAPYREGTYREYVEPVAEFSEWVGPDWGVYWDITVKKSSAIYSAPSTGGEPIKSVIKQIPSQLNEVKDTTGIVLRSFTRSISKLLSNIGSLFKGWFNF